MVACQMTVDLFEFNTSDFIDGIEYGGAATFFEFAGESDICLYV
jgi:peroxiredoxin family protein